MTEKQPVTLLVLICAILFPSVLTYVYFILLAGTQGIVQQTAYLLGKTVQFALPVLWVALICRSPWRLRRVSSRGLTEGCLFGILVAGLMVTLYFCWLAQPGEILASGSPARQAIENKIRHFGLDLTSLALLGLFYSVIHSGLEEYYWRWFVFRQLSNHIPWHWSALISSLGFMAHHVLLLGTYFGFGSWMCLVGSLGVAIGGYYWARLYHRSDSIYGPWIGHGFIDAAIFTIGIVIMMSVNAAG